MLWIYTKSLGRSVINIYKHSSESTLQTCDNCSSGMGFVTTSILELV